jgi:hypothetical protein
VDDLAAAALRALDALADLRGDMEHAEDRLSRAQGFLGREGQELETDWSRISRDLGELMSSIAGWSHDLVAEAAAVSDSRRELESSGHRLDNEAGQEREAAERELGSFIDHVHALESEVQHAVEEAEQASGVLRDKLGSIDDEIDESLSRIRTLLEEDLAGELSGFEEELEARARAVQSLLLDEFASRIDEKIEVVLQRLRAAQERLAEALSNAGTSIKDAAESAVASWVRCQEEVGAGLARLTETVGTMLDELKQLSQNRGEQTGHRRHALAQAAEATEASLEAALALIQSTEQALRRYDFVHF